jgi:pimeloyl-ACP methyl ester carboxylesterase
VGARPGPRRPGRVTATLALVLALIATSCGGGTDVGTTTTTSATSRPVAPGVTAAPITWRDCGDGLECAEVLVPADWDAPDGTQIGLALARRPAGDPGRRVGALLVNPGGPGASGIAWLRRGGPVEIGERFDIVAWDPRGVGASTALDCAGVGGTQGTEVHRADTTDRDGGDHLALLQAFVDACATGSAEIIDDLGTARTVSDMEAIRIGLGGEPLNYLGFSYGTYLGLAYAERYGPNLRAMVLDGVVDPTSSLEDLLAAQLAAMEPLVAEAAATPTVGPDLYQQLLADPRVDPAVLGFAAISSTYGSDGVGALRAALLDAIAGDNRRLTSLAEGYWGAASFTAYLGTLCTDLPRPVGLEAHRAMTERLRDLSPRLGDVVAGEVKGCALWPVPDGVRRDALGDTAPPLLVVGTTGDAATPLAMAERVAGSLGDPLVVFDGGGHTAWRDSPCVRRIATGYLVDLTLPTTGTRCGNGS